MVRINHVALKVADLEAATKFYENVFGFRQVKTGRSRGHISRHLTDGYVDLALSDANRAGGSRAASRAYTAGARNGRKSGAGRSAASVLACSAGKSMSSTISRTTSPSLVTSITARSV